METSKRKAQDEEDPTRREGSKARRLTSPTPMELGTPNTNIILTPGRQTLPSLGELTGAMNSTRLSDPESMAAMTAPRTPTPPRASRFSSRPADRGRSRGSYTRRRRSHTGG